MVPNIHKLGNIIWDEQSRLKPQKYKNKLHSHKKKEIIFLLKTLQKIITEEFYLHIIIIIIMYVDCTDSLDSLSPSVTIDNRSWQVL